MDILSQTHSTLLDYDFDRNKHGSKIEFPLLPPFLPSYTSMSIPAPTPLSKSTTISEQHTDLVNDIHHVSDVHHVNAREDKPIIKYKLKPKVIHKLKRQTLIIEYTKLVEMEFDVKIIVENINNPISSEDLMYDIYNETKYNPLEGKVKVIINRTNLGDYCRAGELKRIMYRFAITDKTTKRDITCYRLVMNKKYISGKSLFIDINGVKEILSNYRLKKPTLRIVRSLGKIKFNERSIEIMNRHDI